eukprot:SAG22_NODE_9649_length_577_cov_0.843096_1_plen_117_part_10
MYICESSGVVGDPGACNDGDPGACNDGGPCRQKKEMVSAMAPHCRTELGTTLSLGGEDNLPCRDQGNAGELLYHDGMASGTLMGDESEILGDDTFSYVNEDLTYENLEDIVEMVEEN